VLDLAEPLIISKKTDEGYNQLDEYKAVLLTPFPNIKPKLPDIEKKEILPLLSTLPKNKNKLIVSTIHGSY